MVSNRRCLKPSATSEELQVLYWTLRGLGLREPHSYWDIQGSHFTLVFYEAVLPLRWSRSIRPKHAAHICSVWRLVYSVFLLKVLSATLPVFSTSFQDALSSACLIEKPVICLILFNHCVGRLNRTHKMWKECLIVLCKQISAILNSIIKFKSIHTVF